MMGTLAPPPAYGSERGSILLESAGTGGQSATTPAPSRGPSAPASSSRRNQHRSRRRDHHQPPNHTPTATSPAGAVSALSSTTPNQPIRPSPLRHSRQASNLSIRSSGASATGSGISSNGIAEGEESDEEGLRNPPTPGLLDISLHSIHRFPMRENDEDSDEDAGRSPSSGEGSEGDESGEDSRLIAGGSGARPALTRDGSAAVGHPATQGGVSPPAYHPIDPHVSLTPWPASPAHRSP